MWSRTILLPFLLVQCVQRGGAVCFPDESLAQCRRSLQKAKQAPATTPEPKFYRRPRPRRIAECGKPVENFVFGGSQVRSGEFPFMAAFVQERHGVYEPFCSGVLLTERHILTAAHCFTRYRQSDFRNGRVDVRIGSSDLTDLESVDTSAHIERVRVHPGYRRRGPGVHNPINDIAIVRLTKNVTSRHVIPVCLPAPGGRRGKTSLVAGWGRSARGVGGGSVLKLRSAVVEEYSKEECQAKYDKFLKKSIRVEITDNKICAGNEKADACAGDSGGPLLWSENRRWTVGGIVTYGPSSCGSVIPGVFARVEDYLPWIYQKLDGYL